MCTELLQQAAVFEEVFDNMNTGKNLVMQQNQYGQIDTPLL